MEKRLKPKWQTYGKAVSVLGLSHEHSRRSGKPEKKTYGYPERDEAKRQAFIEQLSLLAPKQIVYVVRLWRGEALESGMDSRDDYAYGWNERGQRFHALKSGRRQGRVNLYALGGAKLYAALCNQHLIAPFTVTGSCNRSVFETWLHTCLIPVLNPGQVVVMDNATFHKGGQIEQLIREAGAQVLYLPPLFS
ncbi:hypothetical protein AVDCRST_MAG81-13 [uncultured Synechococcales cyanobacterium]|uniref:Tc1-like transposase DDE domain-containing protein n=1 Tax=uncultured Synechococcales cyanobacterium TaxID=1936017 RepID=A0A6J4UM54_9CYAN|nr:hypothetical protein AVDCRST_MAG81-13 [uncultured Synechococcales cyanobacterium]